jgi:altronate hydrolase
MMETQKKIVLQLHDKDNVLVALQDLAQGALIHWNKQDITLTTKVDAKHKFTLNDMAIGDAVYMYGVLVGKASKAIAKGEAITTENLKHESAPYSAANRKPYQWQTPDVSKWAGRTFMGYPRTDGLVGTRNYWLVIPLVFCENRNIMIMKDAFERELGYAQPEVYREQLRGLIQEYTLQKEGKSVDNLQTYASADGRKLFPNIDGIKFLTHEMGCGATNRDSQTLAQVFAGFALNPNVAGITILSLGCQKTQLEDLKEEIANRSKTFDKPVLYFNQQTYGTEQALMTDAMKQTFEGIIEINKIERKPTPITKLNIGLKCGGSDGFSGISANPALGHVSDILTSLGGTTLLAEFPELCGAEQELIDRCETQEDAQKFATLMDEYAAKAASVGATFDMNPSKGNIKDGLITDAIKSAGAAKKGGNAYVTGVLDYTEQPQKSGLHLLCTPGNDVLATTGMAASGANIILFTTGLGTPTGNAVTPTVKISTNTKLAEKMTDIIDFNCGAIISGEETIAENGDRMLEYIIKLASGEYITKAEKLGQDDFIPWRRDINL